MNRSRLGTAPATTFARRVGLGEVRRVAHVVKVAVRDLHHEGVSSMCVRSAGTSRADQNGVGLSVDGAGGRLGVLEPRVDELTSKQACAVSEGHILELPTGAAPGKTPQTRA